MTCRIVSPRKRARCPDPRQTVVLFRGRRERPQALSPDRLRLLGIPVLAVGRRDTLPRAARSSGASGMRFGDGAAKTLGQVLKQLNLEPVRYAPIKTVSSSKEKVVCNAVMPLPDGANVVADYTFYWQGGKANMRYSVHREAAEEFVARCAVPAR